MEEVAQVSPLKKVPSKCKRGLAARLAAKKEKVSEENDSSEISEESAVYSTQVARMLSKRGLPDANQLQLLSDDSDENDEIIPSKKCKAKKNSEKGMSPKISILLSDDEDENISENISCTSTEKNFSPADDQKSPSPPPPPDPPLDVPVHPKRPRMSKAIKQLSDAKSYLQRELSMLNTSCTDVDDVICLDDSLDEKSIFFFVQCNAELQKHRLGKWDPFKKLFDTIAEQQKISFGDIMLSLNDVTIRPSDTPHSVNLKSADTIVMYKNSGKVFGDEDSSDLSGIQLVVQSRNSKKKLEFHIDPMAPLQLLINKYSIQTKTDPSHYRLQFDGEDVLPQDTPADLELEDGFCLDIIETT
ncbi:NFATC2-interacting protein [Magallana gigas]|uniref:NFATC2-interacting protein n=1 Tax=Magallana gigas TaxID=29159 RepID=UPI0033400B3B